VDDNTAAPGGTTAAVRREGPDPVTLTAGGLTLAASIYVLLGGTWNLHWLAAVGAVVVGVVLLLASLRPRRGE
jgi:uncharacterized membrane protein HdeD (DUF308 family)